MCGPFGPPGPPGPRSTGEFGQLGGSGQVGPDGRVHYTDYRDGFHTSWDEGHDGVADVHSTIHGIPGVTIQHPTDNRGNPR
ncbi:hypothetical protein KKB40_06030 [Patescibacteria group bacterium]|nr:hypothetical protein [Patescibacteria group bacterium]